MERFALFSLNERDVAENLLRNWYRILRPTLLVAHRCRLTVLTHHPALHQLCVEYDPAVAESLAFALRVYQHITGDA